MPSSTPPSPYSAAGRDRPRYGRSGLAVVATTAAVLALVLLAVWAGVRQGLIEQSADDLPPLDMATLRPGDPGTGGIDIRPSSNDHCVPYDPEYVWPELNYVDCDAEEAFWVVDAESDEVDAYVDPDSLSADESVVGEVCGQDFRDPLPGRAWLDVVTWYDIDDLSVTYLACVRAIPNPDETGRMPVMPTVGDCFDDSDSWWTVPCDHEHVIGAVKDVIITPDTPDLSDEDFDRLAEHCLDGDSSLQAIALDGGTNYVICYDDL